LGIAGYMPAIAIVAAVAATVVALWLLLALLIGALRAH